MLVFAQFSDTHLDGSQARAGRTAAVMEYLEGLSQPLAAVLVTGDIADHGHAAEYEQARALLTRSPHPVFSCPGNHDVRSAYRGVLLGEDSHESPEIPVNRAYQTPDALFLLCDSTMPGRDDGSLTDGTLDWLDTRLAERPDLPAFVCFHHPPSLLHSPYIDAIRQSGTHRLAEVTARHPQVVGFLCGHAHTPAATTFAGRPLLVAPGVASTLVLPWEQGDIVDLQAPPAVLFHVLDDERRLTTHVRVVPPVPAGA